MVDITKRYIQIQGKKYPIKDFQCWWAVEGLGLFASLEEAQAKIGQENVNLINLRPVPVAVAEQDGVYEAL